METINLNSVKNVIDAGLCTSCGVCAGVCPADAISMIVSHSVYVPDIDQKKCLNCGICLKTCPGYEINFRRLAIELFGEQPENALLGNYFDCYVGHSTTESIRFSSSSGGIVTQLLLYALNSGFIDGALITQMSAKTPLEPEVFIARTREKIISGSKSKYCPVNISMGLKHILKFDGRYAVVGLPCHIHGIRKAQLYNKKLAERIVLTIGLFCARATCFEGTQFYLKSIGVSKSSLISISYRDQVGLVG